MNVVATGFIVRRDPSGLNVVAWHRHGSIERSAEPCDVFEDLTWPEMVDAVQSYLDTYRPGDECSICQGWSQPSMWGHADRPEGM